MPRWKASKAVHKLVSIHREMRAVEQINTLKWACSHAFRMIIGLKMPLSKNIQWDKTRRLMNGSLLALTLDSFETVVWAVVYNRAEDVIRESMIDVQLVNDGGVGSFNLSLAPQVSAAINFWR